jgi:hypothetical protein
LQSIIRENLPNPANPRSTPDSFERGEMETRIFRMTRIDADLECGDLTPLFPFAINHPRKSAQSAQIRVPFPKAEK